MTAYLQALGNFCTRKIPFTMFLESLIIFIYILLTFQIHLVKPRDAEAIRVIRELCHFYQVTFDDNCMSRIGQDLPELDAETALIMDAVQLYISVIKSANITSGRSIKCDDNDTWEYGVEVYNMLKEVSGSDMKFTKVIARQINEPTLVAIVKHI